MNFATFGHEGKATKPSRQSESLDLRHPSVGLTTSRLKLRGASAAQPRCGTHRGDAGGSPAGPLAAPRQLQGEVGLFEAAFLALFATSRVGF